MTDKITAKQMLDYYKKALIVDMDRKNIFIINKGAVKVYSHKRYQDVMDDLGLTEFDADDEY